jgi:hypothetical protein
VRRSPALVWVLLNLGACLRGGGDVPPPDDTLSKPPDDTDSEPVTPEDDTDLPVSDGECPAYVAPEPERWTLRPNAFRDEPIGEGRDVLHCLVTQDLDGDGEVDVAWGRETTPGGDSGALMIRWGGAAPTIQEVALDLKPWSCLAKDTDGDGALELLLFDRGGVAELDGLERREAAWRRAFALSDDRFRYGVLSVAEVDLDADADGDLVIAASGYNPNCGFAQPDEGDTGDVIVVNEGMTMGSVSCLLREPGGGWSLADGAPCPAALRAHATVYPFQISLQDLGGDTKPEILATGDYAVNVFLQSSPTGWVDESVLSGFAEYNHAMGVAWTDFDGDGLRDAFVTDLGPNQARRNVDCSLFFDDPWVTGVGPLTRSVVTWGPVLADFDQNGAEDLFIPNSLEPPEGHDGSECEQFRNGMIRGQDFVMFHDGHGTFSRLPIPGPRADVARVWTPVQSAGADLDRDGDVDVVVSDRARGTVVFWNEAQKAGGWIGVAPVDARGLPVTGVRVVVDHGGGLARARELWLATGTTGQEEPVARFGIGAATGPLDVHVRWPDGRWTAHPDLALGQVHPVVQP